MESGGGPYVIGAEKSHFIRSRERHDQGSQEDEASSLGGLAFKKKKNATRMMNECHVLPIRCRDNATNVIYYCIYVCMNIYILHICK